MCPNIMIRIYENVYNDIVKFINENKQLLKEDQKHLLNIERFRV